MPVPDFHKLMLPTLQALGDGEDQSTASIYERMAAIAGLDDAARSEINPDGKTVRYKYRGSYTICGA